MAILNLQGPYSLLYEKAYIRESKDGRKRVDLFNSVSDRTTVSYARYLLSIKEGRILEDYEEADHIDSDPTNDNLDNLQILTKEEHRVKTKKEVSGRSYTDCMCDNCGTEFVRETREIRYKTIFCSRSCRGQYYSKDWQSTRNVTKFTEEQIDTIKALRDQNLSDRKISELMNISKYKIYYLRKKLLIS